jgi:hypothetical protein
MFHELFNYIKWVMYCYFGMWLAVAITYALTASDSAAPFLDTDLSKTITLILIPAAPVLAFYRRKKMGPPKKPVKKETFYDEDQPQQKSGSSTMAKIALGMSAVALAKSRGPNKVPTVTPRDGGARNINIVHKKGNRYVVTYETLHPATGWQRDKKEIGPGIIGWNHWGGLLDVYWDNI